MRFGWRRFCNRLTETRLKRLFCILLQNNFFVICKPKYIYINYSLTYYRMKKENHLEKAKRIEKSIKRLDRKDDWELIVEGIYGAVQHYTSYLCESLHGEHQDTHKGLIRYLKEHILQPYLINSRGWMS